MADEKGENLERQASGEREPQTIEVLWPTARTLLPNFVRELPGPDYNVGQFLYDLGDRDGILKDFPQILKLPVAEPPRGNHANLEMPLSPILETIADAADEFFQGSSRKEAFEKYGGQVGALRYLGLITKTQGTRVRLELQRRMQRPSYKLVNLELVD